MDSINGADKYSDGWPCGGAALSLDFFSTYVCCALTLLKVFDAVAFSRPLGHRLPNIYGVKVNHHYEANQSTVGRYIHYNMSLF